MAGIDFRLRGLAHSGRWNNPAFNHRRFRVWLEYRGMRFVGYSTLIEREPTALDIRCKSSTVYFDGDEPSVSGWYDYHRIHTLTSQEA